MRLRREKDHDLVPRGPHSPIPRLEELPADLWERPSPMRGVRFDRSDQARRLQALQSRIREFPPIDGFRMWNGYYEAVDAEVLWAILRELRPGRVVELGSGWSSMIIAAALKANGGDAEYEVYDPLPREPAPPHVRRVPAQEVPEDVFAALADRDVLFVDTTHTVKTGGDVNRIVLDVLPRLAPGVLVHFHDVLLPDEVDRRWIESGWYWTEQYLLQAFLTGNDAWRVELALHALGLSRPEELASAFWVRRTR